MKIEVIFYDRIGNYRNGDIVELEDGPFLRALLLGGKADVLNPPDWSPNSHIEPEIEDVLPLVVEAIPVPEAEATPLEKSRKNPRKNRNNESFSGNPGDVNKMNKE